MTYAVGSLVRARGREWIVLPESLPAEQLLVLRPLGGTDDEITGIYTPLELVEPATFELPDPRRDLGNARAAHLLVDALRLGFRAGAGPFRCLARIAVEPRPYQLVPLLMALQLDPVRLLIADDVGVGKTIEALLIARELLDRGEIHRIAVLCPPHLAEQWQRAMNDLFHLGAVLVLAGTAARLERDLPPGELIFEHHPVTVVSMDYIKSERRCHAFLRACPELVIVDEAHTCTSGQAGGNQRRHDLLRQLAAAPERHLLLVTATPHSGDEANFRSLITLLDPELTQLPADLGGDANRKHRERLARHLVQRRRGDLQRFHGQDTPFPRRESAEEHYTLARPYRDLLDRGPSTTAASKSATLRSANTASASVGGLPSPSSAPSPPALRRRLPPSAAAPPPPTPTPTPTPMSSAAAPSSTSPQATPKTSTSPPAPRARTPPTSPTTAASSTWPAPPRPSPAPPRTTS
jgi:hypothetical protein